jgi:hypothetical protein
MTDRHSWDIEIIDIDFHIPYIEETYQQIKRNAAGRHFGESMHDVANAFAKKLEQAFNAEGSTISEPFPERNYWLVYVPIQGGFDNSESKVCISFYVIQHQ